MKTDFKQCLSGFDHIKRYWDRGRDSVVAKILPGEVYVTKQNELISTVLGSCISACVYDYKMGIGGMNHFMLPANNNAGIDSLSCRYGNWAMEFLINEIIKNGGSRDNFKIKIFGGGKIIKGMGDIGEGNIMFVSQYLKNEGFLVESHDVGGPWPRKVLFNPTSGKAHVKKLRSMHNDTIQQREFKYLHEIEEQDTHTDIELF
ncbi:chemoreceptor glutamine deamidase CheD [Pseudoalteromonas piratica]|uniref:Probable chemoreceptor glutamine deamidase CheD n=1 Tax=Pseudoalteromonas piratica TaxID=1348114 RepID=A0A0A7EDI3_9GAMM|nr:chemoreceptor glutamine deamidase CheD [Pseudoalteromonas piratica]AIY64111.1 chemotaxis protein CheD [Pseudoalteromonas piratica]